MKADTSPVALATAIDAADSVPRGSYLTEEQVAVDLGVTTRTLQRWRATGDGPAYTRIGPRMLRYHIADLEAWKVKATFRHSADELSATASTGRRSPIRAAR